MPVADNLASIYQLIDAWNSHDLDRIARFFHDDFENHQLPFPPVIGRDRYLDHCRRWFDAYPDFRIGAVVLFGQDELVCLESRGGGIRRGAFFGADADGRPEVNFACDVFEFRDGLIELERGYWDFSVYTGELAPQTGGHGPAGSRFFLP